MNYQNGDLIRKRETVGEFFTHSVTLEKQLGELRITHYIDDKIGWIILFGSDLTRANQHMDQADGKEVEVWEKETQNYS